MVQVVECLPSKHSPEFNQQYHKKSENPCLFMKPHTSVRTTVSMNGKKDGERALNWDTEVRQEPVQHCNTK
jgi:hypothetical protein